MDIILLFPSFVSCVYPYMFFTTYSSIQIDKEFAYVEEWVSSTLHGVYQVSYISEKGLLIL